MLVLGKIFLQMELIGLTLVVFMAVLWVQSFHLLVLFFSYIQLISSPKLMNILVMKRPS